jgi:general secretion pathway protein D
MGARRDRIASAAARDLAWPIEFLPPRRVGLALVFATTVLLAACTPAPAPAPPPAALPAPTRLVNTSGTEALPLPAPAPGIEHRGTAPAPRLVPGAAPPVAVTPGGDVTLNFTDADIREVVRAVVGDILGLNYTIDAKVQGTVTVQTMKPLPRAAVLATLGRVLRANGAALTEDGGMIRVTPLEGAAKGASGPGGLGYGVRVLPLQYVPAAELDKVLEPFVPAGAVLQVDSAHNILVLSGTREDMDAIADLVRSFDADWLSRMSFAIVPLSAGDADTIIDEMQAIIAGATGGAEGAEGALRLVPVERLNAILVITAQPRYLDWARQQIATLDSGSEDGAERTYIYHVQYGRASDLADVLQRVFGPGATTPGRPASSNSSYLQSNSFGASGSMMGATGGAMTGGAASSGGLGGAASTGGLAGGAPAGGLSAAAPLANVLGTSPGATTTTTTTSATQGTAPSGSDQQTAPGRTPIRIVTDERNNAIVIVTTAHEYRRVEEALHRLDVKPLQVVIEATIAEVTLNDELQFGLQWFFRNGQGNGAFTNVTSAMPTQSFPGFSYILTETNVQLVLNALRSITNVNVVSSPQLMVLNNQTAQLQVGQQVPVPVQQQQSVETPEAPLVNTISYLNTGVILSVTPRANATGEVTLDIEQEVSDVATTTTAGLNAPTIDERRVKSTVSVQSGESVALGGLISNSVTKNRSEIPLLGEIPLIGALFRNDDNTTTRTELLVLIEPRIINGSDDAHAATEDLERQMQDVQPFAPAAR